MTDDRWYHSIIYTCLGMGVSLLLDSTTPTLRDSQKLCSRLWDRTEFVLVLGMTDDRWYHSIIYTCLGMGVSLLLDSTTPTLRDSQKLCSRLWGRTEFVLV